MDGRAEPFVSAPNVSEKQPAFVRSEESVERTTHSISRSASSTAAVDQMPEQVNAEVSAMRFCAECGMQCEVASRFCGACGSMVAANTLPTRMRRENGIEGAIMAEFFDKVKKGVIKGVSTASVKSKEILEVTRLKSRINTVQSQKSSAIEELGNIVYTMLLKGAIDEVRINEKGSAILKFDNQIKDLESEIVQVQNSSRESLGMLASIGKCVCGADLYEDIKFCGACGKKNENSQIPSAKPVA